MGRPALCQQVAHLLMIFPELLLLLLGPLCLNTCVHMEEGGGGGPLLSAPDNQLQSLIIISPGHLTCALTLTTLQSWYISQLQTQSVPLQGLRNLKGWTGPVVSPRVLGQWSSGGLVHVLVRPLYNLLHSNRLVQWALKWKTMILGPILGLANVWDSFSGEPHQSGGKI